MGKKLLHLGIRRCNLCGIVYPLSLENFTVHKHQAGGFCAFCRGCDRKRKRESWSKTDKLGEHWNPHFLFVKIKQRSLPRFGEITTAEEFEEWYLNSPKICTYCGLPEDRVKEDAFSRRRNTRRLSIDRKDNSRGYITGNLCLACLGCNAIKSDIFSYNEMREIGLVIEKMRKRRKTPSVS